MKNRILFAIAILFSTNAMAATTYKQFYLVNGKETDATTAIMSAIKGNEAFKCQSVEAKVSKSGTSIGVRNVKKPRATSN